MTEPRRPRPVLSTMNPRPIRIAFATRPAVPGALVLALALAGPAAAQTLYKWTDDKGNVHYTDKAPDASRGGTVLDKQGRPVRKLEVPPSEQQVRERAEEAERQKALAREQEIVLRKDRALLASYTTESEIDLTRARAVATVETQIASARAYLAQLEKRKRDVDARKKSFGDKPIPPALERESESIDGEVRKNTELVAQKQRELVAVSARYDADKARWRELKAQADANEAAVRGAGRPTAITPAASTTAAKK